MGKFKFASIVYDPRLNKTKNKNNFSLSIILEKKNYS